MKEGKERAQLTYELYAAYLGSDLGQPLEPWDKLPESVRGAWRFTVSQLLGLQPSQIKDMDKHPPGPGRCWANSTSDYTWQVAKNLDELRLLPWVNSMICALAPVFHQLSVSSTGGLRAPWDREVTLSLLMIEIDGGARWYVLGGLENPELYGLPTWAPPAPKPLRLVTDG